MKTKATKRVLSLILTVLMIVPLVATIGCGKKEASVSDLAQVNDAAEVNDAVDETTEKTKAETEAEKADLSDALSSGTTDTIAFADLKDYTIVYYNSGYAKLCAERIQAAIQARTGNTLAMTTDSAAETEKEILVGKTNRDESKELRATYSRLNVCYDVKVDGTKLVVMAEGYKTLDYAAEKMESFLANESNAAFAGSVYDCDISATIDTLGTASMLDRAEGTDLRVFHWNMAAPLISGDHTKDYAYKEYADVYNDKLRAELIADTILQMMPDVITTNEFYLGHWSGVYEVVLREIGDYYNVLESRPEDGVTPIDPNFPNDVNYTINSNILYRKALNLSVVYSSWRYSAVTEDYFHGYHTAVFKTAENKNFIISVGHYTDSRKSNAEAKAHAQAIADAKTKSSVADNTPTIVTGDMYTGYTSSSKNSGYKYWVSQGYVDSQRNALVNANGNVSHGTFHEAGIRQTSRISEDFIWIKNGLTALCFKVLTSEAIDDSSDHYPVMADIKFN